MTSRSHLHALDAMRWVAAVVVLVYHRNWTLPGSHLLHLGHGWLAVDFFFILSGFVLARAYDDDLAAPGGLARFAWRRVVRLAPLLLLGGMVGLVSALVLGDVTVGGALLNAVALPALPSMASAPFKANGPVWSLSFELIANAAHALIVARAPRLFGPVLALSAAAWVGMLVEVRELHLTGVNFDSLGWGFARSLFPFLLGVWLARKGPTWAIPARWAHPGWPCVALLLVLAFPTLPRLIPGAIYPALCVLVVFPALVVWGSAVVVSGRQARICTALGGMSYAVYVLHMPVLRLSDVLVSQGMIPPTVQVLLVTGPILVFSAIAWKWLDVPVRRWL